MGDIDNLIISDQYMILIALSILFMILAIYRRTPLLDMITFVCWSLCSVCHLLASPVGSPLYPIAFLYLIFVFLFLVLCIVDTFSYLDYRKARKGAVVV